MRRLVQGACPPPPSLSTSAQHSKHLHPGARTHPQLPSLCLCLCLCLCFCLCLTSVLCLCAACLSLPLSLLLNPLFLCAVQARYPEVHAKLLARALELDLTQIDGIKGDGWRGSPDPAAACAAAAQNNGAWGPHMP